MIDAAHGRGNRAECFREMKRSRRKCDRGQRDPGKIDQGVAEALAGIVFTAAGGRGRRRMFGEQAANECGAVFVPSALQAIRVAAEDQAQELCGKRKCYKPAADFL